MAAGLADLLVGWMGIVKVGVSENLLESQMARWKVVMMAE